MLKRTYRIEISRISTKRNKQKIQQKGEEAALAARYAKRRAIEKETAEKQQYQMALQVAFLRRKRAIILKELRYLLGALSPMPLTLPRCNTAKANDTMPMCGKRQLEGW